MFMKITTIEDEEIWVNTDKILHLYAGRSGTVVNGGQLVVRDTIPSLIGDL